MTVHLVGISISRAKGLYRLKILMYTTQRNDITSSCLLSLLHERLEMVRIAEEVARQTAESAIRQMTTGSQSIKFSLGSQELLQESETE